MNRGSIRGKDDNFLWTASTHCFRRYSDFCSVLIIGLCILLRVYKLNTGRTSVRNKVFLVLDFIVNFSHYMFRPRLAAIFRWFANTKNIQGSHYTRIFLIIALCILLRVYQVNTGRTSLRNKVFLVLDFIVHFSHYMFRPSLAAIFRCFANTKNIQGSHYIYSVQ
jgi:hypothetical protein